MKVTFAITSYSGSDADVVLKLVKLLFLKENNETFWTSGVKTVKNYFLKYFRNDNYADDDNEICKNLKKCFDSVEDHLISRDVMNNIEMIHTFDDNIKQGDPHSSNVMNMVNKFTEFYKSIGFTNYKILISNEKQSLGTSRNITAKNATGIYIYFIDDDDMYINIEHLYNSLLKSLSSGILYDMIMYTRMIDDREHDILHYECSTIKCFRLDIYRDAFECPGYWYEMMSSESFIYAFGKNILINTDSCDIMYFKFGDRSDCNRKVLLPIIRTLQNVYKFKNLMPKENIFTLLYCDIYIELLHIYMKKNIIHSKDYSSCFIKMWNYYNNLYYAMYYEELPLFDDIDYKKCNLLNISLFSFVGFNTKMLQKFKIDCVNNHEVFDKFVKVVYDKELHKLINKDNIKLSDTFIHLEYDTKKFSEIKCTDMLKYYVNPNLLGEYTIITNNEQYNKIFVTGTYDDNVFKLMTQNDLEIDLKYNDYIKSVTGYILM